MLLTVQAVVAVQVEVVAMVAANLKVAVAEAVAMKKLQVQVVDVTNILS